MNRVLIVLVGLLLIVVVMAVTLSQSLVVIQRVARVSSLIGSAQIKPPNSADFIPLKDQSLVLTGTVLQTAPGASVTLNWVDGTRLLVGGDTTMTVLKCQVDQASHAETSLFHLTTGKLMVRVRKLLSGQSKFEIETPTATAGVRGTIFQVQVDAAGQTQVAVLEGQVNLNASGQTLEIKPGFQAIAGKREAEVKPLSAADRAGLAGSPEDLGPYLLLDSPPEGAPIAPGVLTVAGVAEDRARVTVNGVAAHINKLHRFKTDLPIPAGATTFNLRVVAIDERGYKTEMARDLPVK